MSETVSQNDMVLFAKASKAVHEAQAAMSFITGHIVETYKLGPEDSVNPATGEIIRADKPE